MQTLGCVGGEGYGCKKEESTVDAHATVETQRPILALVYRKPRKETCTFVRVSGNVRLRARQLPSRCRQKKVCYVSRCVKVRKCLITDVCASQSLLGRRQRGLCIMLGSWSCLGQASPDACTHNIREKGKASFNHTEGFGTHHNQTRGARG